MMFPTNIWIKNRRVPRSLHALSQGAGDGIAQVAARLNRTFITSVSLSRTLPISSKASIGRETFCIVAACCSLGLESKSSRVFAVQPTMPSGIQVTSVPLQNMPPA